MRLVDFDLLLVALSSLWCLPLLTSRTLPSLSIYSTLRILLDIRIPRPNELRQRDPLAVLMNSTSLAHIHDLNSCVRIVGQSSHCQSAVGARAEGCAAPCYADLSFLLSIRKNGTGVLFRVFVWMMVQNPTLQHGDAVLQKSLLMGVMGVHKFN